MDDDNKSRSSGYSDGDSLATSFHDFEEAQEGEMEATDKGIQRSARIKLFVILLLIASAFAISLSVALVSLDWEMDAIRQDFVHDADKVFDHIGVRGKQNLETMATVGTSLTSYSTSKQEFLEPNTPTWPFITANNFEPQGLHALDILNTSKVFMSPLVKSADREEWEAYSNKNQDSLTSTSNPNSFEKNRHLAAQQTEISPLIFKIVDADGSRVVDMGPAPFQPVWQVAPSTTTETVAAADVKFNLRSLPRVAQAIDHVYKSRAAVISSLAATETEQDIVQRHLAGLFEIDGQQEGEPVSLLLLPIFDSFAVDSRNVVGVTVAPFLWKSYLMGTFGVGTNGIMVVFETCDQTYTYKIDEQNAMYLGQGDLHHPYYEEDLQTADLAFLLQRAGFETTSDGIPFGQDFCSYQINVYPTPVFQNQHMSSSPVTVTTLVVFVFAFTFLLFLVYGGLTDGRLQELHKKAIRTTQLVNTLFPKEIQERLFKAETDEQRAIMLQSEQQNSNDPLSKIKTFLKDTETDKNDLPIADLWPNCTVLFADIVGFTAWSGCREPVQVFTLLENIYKAFDTDAKRRGVFKVETVGDCYVACCGLPTPRKDHAVVMARFARDCRDQMTKLTRKLEVSLGPDTADLQLRLGLNSGPVTAGVLRGEKGRFQLFGDTVNTAARMESNGKSNKIHASATTAELLTAAGKQHWVTPREEMIEAKGKGSMQTFWVEPASSGSTTATSSTPSTADADDLIEESMQLDDKTMRLINWNVDVFSRMIRQIVAHREATGSRNSPKVPSKKAPAKLSGATVIDEVKEIVELPESRAAKKIEVRDTKELSPVVMEQLKQYITMVANMYHSQNPFHNMDHASHVTMSVTKLLSRIVAPSDNDSVQKGESLHDHSYGLASNPLTQFACVFAALIHDVDHPGVPNAQLVKEGAPMAQAYRNKSVAEQNSVDISWDLLQQGMFEELRAAICANAKEMRHFRQLVVNAVMATDIMDKDLKALRNSRWDKAFGDDEVGKENIDRKATIVIEHMIQASDVAHTMQHWHVYRKWNELFFMECYEAYKAGRAEKDPAENWYKGEIGFFDFYIIPLAKKLSDCGVFGVSSDEYLNYAQKNRDEWEQRGKEIVEGMIEKIKSAETSSY